MFKMLILVATAALLATPAAAAEPTRVVTVGDSITAGGYDYGSYPSRLDGRLRGVRVTNVGHGGQCVVRQDCALRILDTFKAEALDRRPDVVIVGGGINDLCGVKTYELKDAYRKLIRRAERRGIEIYLNTITPYAASWPWPCEDQRRDVNRWIRTQPRFIDMSAALSNERHQLRKRFSCDGLHPNGQGLARMAIFAARALGAGGSR